MKAAESDNSANRDASRSRDELLAEVSRLRAQVAEIEPGCGASCQAAGDSAFPGSARDFETLLDNLPGTAYRCLDDADRTMIYLSAGCEDLTEYAADSLISNRDITCGSIIHPADRDASNARIRAAIEAQGWFEDSYRIVRADGAVRWVWDRARVVASNRSQPAVLEGFIADVTPLRAAEDAVRESELRLNAIFDNSPAEIYLKDRDGRYVQISRRFEELFGVTNEEMRGKLPEDAHYSELAATTRAQDLEVLNTGKIVEREEKALIEGEEHTLLTVKFPIRDGDEITGLGAIVTDITDRVLAEQATRVSEERMRTIASNIPGCVFRRVLHPDGTQSVPYLSSGIEALTGLSVKDVMADPSRFAGRIHPDDIGLWQRGLEESARTMSIYEMEFRTFRSDGSLCWCRAHARPHPGPEGEVIWDGVTLDVTELKKTEAALRLAKEEAVDANRAKSAFLARMSHELRTPMNAIIGFSEVMRGQVHGRIGNPRYEEYVSDIHDSGHHLLSLINEILDLSRIESGKVKVSFESVSIAAAIDESARFLRPKIESGALKLSQSVEDGLPPIRADRRMIKQILLNLLGNAEKFSPPGGCITLGARRSPDGDLELSVSDEGDGIPAADLDQVMEPFHQAGNVLVRNHEGTGLGLYLVRMLAELHVGTVMIESSEGAGTTVRVVLPGKRFVGRNSGVAAA